MSTILNADDLMVGAYLAVHSRVLRRRGPRVMHRGESMPEVEEMIAQQMNTSNEGGPRPGLPLRVIAIELPFLYCMVVEPGGTEAGPSILDTRNVRLMRLSAETISALVGLATDDEPEEDSDEQVPDFESATQQQQS